ICILSDNSSLLNICNLLLSLHGRVHPRVLHSFPTRRSSDLGQTGRLVQACTSVTSPISPAQIISAAWRVPSLEYPWLPIWVATRSEEHTSELQSRENLVCRLLLEKKN